MASPNSSFDDLLATTVQELVDDLFDNIMNKNAITAMLKSYGMTRGEDGGPTIVEPIEYAENGSYKRYSGYGQLNTSSNQVFSAFQYPWRQVAINIQASGREILQNMGRSQRRNLLKSRVKNAKSSFENSFNEDLLSDGSATEQINGLQSFISDDGTGQVGGVSRASFSFAKNQFYRGTTDGGAAISSSNLVDYMDELDADIQAVRGMTKVILADDVLYKLFEKSVHPLQRISQEKGALGKLGFKTYQYKDAEVVLEPAICGMPASTMYFLDPEVLSLVYHSSRNLVRLPKRDSFNQDAQIEYLAWMGNLTAKNFRRLGVLNND